VVSGAKINRGVGFMSFSEDMRARGLTPHSEVRRLTSEVAEASIAAQLGLAAGARVVYVERLRFANNEPVALERVYLPYDRFAGLLGKESELARRSMYEIMEEEFDSRPTFADETVEAVLLHQAEARLFGVPRNSPALLAQRVTRDERGKPIETVQTLYRGDRYRMTFVRKR
jgi:GntR family transcriptional regulator